MRRFRLFAVVLATFMPGFAAAQGSHAAAATPLPGTILGQDRDKDQPVQIDAASLQVQDKNRKATFAGNVQVVQGDMTMKCQTLVVYYGQEVGIAANAQAATKPEPGMPKGAQNIRRIEALGGVTVVTKDQNASGDSGVYDLQSKTITLSGNVVVSQGQNVIHGERVVVDTVSGNARVESKESAGTVPGRVRALILPNKNDKGGEGNMMTIGPGRTN